ncbi:MAG: SEC-C metal-binding domain-containing protein [archaeon]
MFSPLTEVKDVRTYKGRFHVQLDIPTTSTLKERDIDKIGALSSWDLDPNGNVERYEGSRSVLIKRENPIYRGGMKLGALQLSGIGYQRVDFSNLLPLISNEEFYPPTAENFISLVPGTLMSTSYAKNSAVERTRPSYRALGTYTHDELEEKVRKTTEVSGVLLSKLVTPTVEAYGWFHDENLRNQEGPFGFIVYPIPSIELGRSSEEIRKKIIEFHTEHGTGIAEDVVSFSLLSLGYVSSLAFGLRELHDVARCAHLQTHFQNYYMVDGKPYLVDWATKTRLPDRESSRLDNILNRTIDLRGPVGSYGKILATFGSIMNPELIQNLSSIFNEGILQAYSGDFRIEITTLGLISRYAGKLGLDGTEFDLMVEWLKDQGLEGFPKKDYQGTTSGSVSLFHKTSQNPKDPPPSFSRAGKPGKPIVNEEPKVGRNDPCPCGSGKKFKKCCG